MGVPPGIDGSGTDTDPFTLHEGAELPAGWTVGEEVIIGGQAKLKVEPPVDWEGP